MYVQTKQDSVLQLSEKDMGSSLWKSIIFLLLQLTWVSGDNSGRSELEKEILQKLLLTSKFNIYVRPHKSENETIDEPLEISVSLYILNLDIDMKKQECSIEMYFREEWYDSRLGYNDQGKLKFLSFHDAVGFWTPDLFFVNEKFGQLHAVTKPNVFVRIYPNGRVLYSQRLTVKLACPMNLRKYPFDTQICTLPIESYGYTANDIHLKWKPETTFGIDEPSGFHISYATAEEVIHFAVQNYSRLELGIYFARLPYPQLIHVYIPIGLLVVASWVSFWLRPSDLVLRLTTALMTMLTSLMVLQFSRDLLYQVCYLTALDVWVGFSFLLVFAAIFENVYVIANQGKSLTFQANTKDGAEVENGVKDKRKLFDIFAGKLPEGHSSVDAFAKLMFPSVFILFNIIYFIYYLI